MKKNTDLALLLIRLTLGGLMLFHGVAKLGHIDGIQHMLTDIGLPAVMAYGVYITELLAPVLMVIGWRTRLASLVYFFGMLTALFLRHADSMFELSKTGGLAIELILLYALPALALCISGAGKYALSYKHKLD
ncbi:DoxX family protein [Formosa sediminum]|uniref:DoxX family protein n=1 Tax=Formosa sediminum TaxID=2594004 RepID=A0A516GTV3_9FLAO|nr:DoxX family protein [Formosa sediminum]QDO94951.1 DoxX family protein [Formosa sediminum]